MEGPGGEGGGGQGERVEGPGVESHKNKPTLLELCRTLPGVGMIDVGLHETEDLLGVATKRTE